MNKSFLLLLFIVCIAVKALPQNNSLNRALNWKIPRTHSIKKNNKVIYTEKYLSFEKAHYPDKKTNLPYYVELIPIDDKAVISVEVQNIEISDLDYDEALNDEAFNLLQNSVKVNWKVFKTRGSRNLQISFIPLVKSRNGKVKKVQAFDISYTIKEANQEEKSLTDNFEDHSVFHKGRWLKVSTNKEGVYKLTFSQLKKNGLSDFKNLGVFGNSEGVLPQDNQVFEDKDPHRLPIQYFKGEDGVFNKGDYIIFYGTSPHRWQYDTSRSFYYRESHPYSENNYYFVTDNASGIKKVNALNTPDEKPSKQIDTYISPLHYERNELNLIESGQHWFGERFATRNNYSFNFEFPNRVEQRPVKINARVAARSSANTQFSISANGKDVFSIPVESVNYNFTGYYARPAYEMGQVTVSGQNLELDIDYSGGNATGWLDYITVNATQNLSLNGDQLHFRHFFEDSSEIVEFNISGVETGISIWDVTEPTNPQKIEKISINNNVASFKAAGIHRIHEYIAFTGDGFFSPAIENNVSNQDLHGLKPVDMLIVTKEKYLNAANELSELHKSQDGLKVAVVTDKQVFNEFSSGAPDPSAIRNFVRYMYERSTPSDSLKYLLLFGDGSYDNRECHENGFLLTYQSEESLHYSNSFVSDDFFGMIDEHDDIEAEMSGLLDVGIGRLPVNTVQEAENAVDKIKSYMDHGIEESWLNNIVFAADDEDNNDHIEDAEQLSELVSEKFKEFNIDKIYLDAYKQKTTATGTRYPGVNESINEKVNNGILLFNYLGHGGEHHLAHERILTKDDISSWSNSSRLPIFLTATCEFTRFDDHTYTSAGEEIFLKEKGGAIALFSTTRLVYANQNYALNRAFYNYVFNKESNNDRPYRLGDIVRITKNNAGTDNNKRNFSLFGDPALRLPIGELNVHTDSIIKNDGVKTDTIGPLDKVSIYGHIKNATGTKSENFNGTLVVNLKDKEKTYYTNGNDGGSTFAYSLRKNSLFKGKTNVEGGQFKIEFILPKDIDPEFGKGKILYWGNDKNSIVQGAYNDFIIGGVPERTINDNKGPEIELFMNTRNFVSGGVTNQNPELLVDLEDENGINISGHGVGHDILATLDNNSSEKIVLNQYFETDEGTYKNGTIHYQLNNLSDGHHTLQLEAWDINNNYSKSSIQFTVNGSEDFKLTKVYNQPNPVASSTAFYFEHNRPNEPMHVTLELYTLSGKRLNQVTKTIEPAGFRVGPIQWQGLGNIGYNLRGGVYIFRIKIRLNENEIASKSGKLIVL